MMSRSSGTAVSDKRKKTKAADRKKKAEVAEKDDREPPADEKKAADEKSTRDAKAEIAEPESAERVEETLPESVDDKIAEIEQSDELSEEDKEDLRRSYLLRRFWQSARGFWGKHGPRAAWILSGAVLLVVVLNIGMTYAMNLWNRGIFDALQNRDSPNVLFLSLIYFPILAASVFFSVMQVYARMTVQRRWRRWLNDRLVDRWLAHGHYYQLNLVSGDHANPEYRIADDLRIATEAPVDFVTGVTHALLSAATFVVVLWTIGGALEFTLGGFHIYIPGFLVVAAVLYAVVASGAMVFIGRRFVQASEDKNQAEAEYRYVLTRLRENGESIALIHGEPEERAGVDRALKKVLATWKNICFQTMKTTIVSQTSSYIAPVLPIILCAPKFLDGSMSLGQVMQAASAFTIVQAAFNWLVDNYPKLADWTASARRVASLMVSLDALQRAEQGDEADRITVTNEGEGAALRLKDLKVTLDDGTAVVDDTEIAIQPGERVLIAGESGTGKSTLVRAIAGLWPWGEGEIAIGKGAKMFLLPQRPYVPIGTLRRAATYPDAADSRSVEEIAKAFGHVGLGHLADRLDEEGPWDQTLSGGEKQRLAFARIFLHNPDIIVLDEATSALDPQSQDKLMELLVKHPEETTLISVGHRPELEAFHSRKIVLERRRGGAKLVSDIHLEQKPGRAHLLRRWLRKRRARRAARRNGRL
jgi:vitamin B12/bleomycin/antimicrobial peptide transport system ATP-binding/permease protein